MKATVFYFSQNGSDLAFKLNDSYLKENFETEILHGSSVYEKTKRAFADSSLIIFIGAVGIAVRAIADFIKDKSQDPAVIVIDDKGKFVIPILSGHLGGANDFARNIAQFFGAEAVITTATDINNKFAVDVFAKKNGLSIDDISKIKLVSGKILSGGKASVYSEYEFTGKLPEELIKTENIDSADIIISEKSIKTKAIRLIPKDIIIGIGCRRNTPYEQIEGAFNSFLSANSIDILSVKGLASINLKADEKGLLKFSEKHSLPIDFYTAEELNSLEGKFSLSDFVKSTAGVDCVCERSAVYKSNGKLLIGKTIADGITFAAAIEDTKLYI